jgi:hypothetical protein
MKKTLLILGNVILGAGFSFAQQTPVSQSPLNKNVVLEELTGINCGYCPDGHKRSRCRSQRGQKSSSGNGQG